MGKEWILGVGASHNGAACLLRGDEIFVAVQEERLTRVKRDRIFGARASLAVAYCLQAADITPRNLDLIVLCVQGRASSPDQDIEHNPQLLTAENETPVMTIPHHLGHAMSSFALSGMDSSAIMIVDGVGSPIEDLTPEERACVLGSEPDGWETISLYEASSGEIRPLQKHVVPGGKWLVRQENGMPQFGSLGGMYSAVAAQVFGDPMEAGQVMGLAPYGKPVFRVAEFFDFERLTFKFSNSIPLRFTHNFRWPECRSEYENLCCSVQQALEVAVCDLAQRLRALCKSSFLCFSGGVALNGVLNERLIAGSGFDRVFVPPAAEDSGTAIGAAYYGLRRLTGTRRRTMMLADSVGRTYPCHSIHRALRTVPALRSLRASNLVEETVHRLRCGQLAGWFQGGSELGPRALGQRSILADPRELGAKQNLNERVKFRASFRPFAPAILEEDSSTWFEFAKDVVSSPFMLRVCAFRDRMNERVPAVAHIDGTGRVQTVAERDNPRFYALLKCFREKTGIPILLNTSFNIRGEPIVETPEDALWCLLTTGLDFCVLEDALVVKRDYFGSILDLVPQMTALQYGGYASTDNGSGRKVLFKVPTPWGDCEHALPEYVLPILHFVDGKRDGWSIYSRVQHELRAPIQLDWFLMLLSQLRRESVITFTEADTIGMVAQDGEF